MNITYRKDLHRPEDNQATCVTIGKVLLNDRESGDNLLIPQGTRVTYYGERAGRVILGLVDRGSGRSYITSQVHRRYITSLGR